MCAYVYMIGWMSVCVCNCMSKKMRAIAPSAVTNSMNHVDITNSVSCLNVTNSMRQ